MHFMSHNKDKISRKRETRYDRERNRDITYWEVMITTPTTRTQFPVNIYISSIYFLTSKSVSSIINVPKPFKNDP